MWIPLDIPPNPLIQIVIEQKQKEPEKEPEPLIDPNGCEPEMYWAKEPPHYCIPKAQATITKSSEPVRPTGSPPLSWWDWGNCTYFVASKRPVGFWNNASSWYSQAQRDGWAVGSVPKVGAIAWEYGHVALVIGISGDLVTIQEMNYKGLGVVTTRTLPASYFSYIY